MQSDLQIETNGRGLYEFTEALYRFVNGTGSGLLTLLLQHTSASLLIQENADPDVQSDLLAWLNRFVPDADDPSLRYLRHRSEGPDDMPAHIKASVLPVSLQIPVRDGRLILGTWQGVYLFEHRDAPHRRRVALHFAADA